MLDPGRYRWAPAACLLTLAFLSVAVVADLPDQGPPTPPDATPPEPTTPSAPEHPSEEEVRDEVRETSQEQRSEARETVREARDEAQAAANGATGGSGNGGSGGSGSGGSGGSGSGGSGGSGSGSGGSGSSGGNGGGSSPVPTPPRTPVPTQAPIPEKLAYLAQQAVAIVRPLVPGDPIGLAKETADRAGRLPQELLPQETASDEAEPQAPQSTASDPVGSSLLAPTLILAAAGAATAATFLGMWLAGSSGAVGTKAAASAAAKTDLRRLLPFASPLFTRFERDTVLGHPRREALYALILQEPGISLQSLGDATGLSRTAVIHHLRLMEQQHLVVSRRVGRSRHYFENGGRYGHDQKEAYAILQNSRSKAVAEFIKGHPGAMQKALCEALGIQPSIAHWHVRRLEEARIVETIRQGRTVAYFPGPGLSAMDPSAASQAPPPAATA